jgi:hypothetical protein
MFTLYTFGDSILDSGRYSDRGLDAGQLIVRNNDVLFPEFTGRDLRARGPARLAHRAVECSPRPLTSARATVSSTCMRISCAGSRAGSPGRSNRA